MEKFTLISQFCQSNAAFQVFKNYAKISSVRKERSLPVLVRVLGVGAIGLAAACGGAKVGQNESEIASQPDIPATPSVEPFAFPTPVVEAALIPQESNLFPDPSFESGDWRLNWTINGVIFAEGGYEKTPNYLSIDKTQAKSGTASLRLTLNYLDEPEPGQIIGGIGSEPKCSIVLPPFNPDTTSFHGNYGFTYNSEIYLSSGFYQIGVSVKASPRIGFASIGVGVSLLKDNYLNLGGFGYVEVDGVYTWPNNWERLTATFQITDEVAQLPLRPSFLVELPFSLQCGSQMDIWVDDVFLAPVTSSNGQEVQVLKPPEEFFWKKLEGETKPLFNKAQPLLSNMDQWTARRLVDGLTGSPQVGDVTKSEKFRFLLDAVSGLVKEYNIKEDTSQGEAQEFLNLAKNICQLLRENFPEEYESKKQQDPNGTCAILE